MPTLTTRPDARALRLWPGVALAALVLLLRFVLPPLFPDLFMVGVIAGVLGLAAIVLWWLFFSRAPWTERIGAVVLMLLAALAVRPFLHPSIDGGMMGMMYAIYAVPPVLGPAFVAWAAISRRLPTGPRWAALAATALLACGAWTLIRTDGVLGSSGSQLAWRWTPTAEERLLARAGATTITTGPDTPASPSTAPAATAPAASPETTPATAAPPATAPAASPEATPPAATATPAASAPAPADAGNTASAETPTDTRPVSTDSTSPRAAWPGFRGPSRDGAGGGIRIETDWTATPPVEVWRRPVGPGWSSFAVQGDRLYTQEQRGDFELVSSYRLSTGEPVWQHRDPVRFYESNGGAGPRATPTIAGGRVFAFGATGILNALDAATGAVAWSHDVASETTTAVPDWGFASSPLVVDGTVIVAASGTLAAYDAATGARRWTAAPRGGSYSSPHLATIDGVRQVLLLSSVGAASFAPASGQLLWEHPWPGGTTIVQPAVLPDGDVLVNNLAATGGTGTRRLAITHNEGGWTVDERWTSNGLKPYFNDFVVHEGQAFGFDGSILSSINLGDGARNWKGGRYGNGQMILLAEQDLLLVLSEDGELALVGATPDAYHEVARIPALNAKTWNHPALVGDLLLIRNGEEMVALRLAVKH